LSVTQVRRLLTASQVNDFPSVFPFLVLQLFAGLRPHEAQQMRWEYLYFETGQIEVKAATSKTRESRFVPMLAPLPEMLLPYRRPSGPITGRNFARALLAVRKASGITPWPKDVLRHCFGSFWLPIHKNRAELAEIMGNSVGIIKRFYRRAIPPQLAVEYWRISLEHAKVIPLLPETRAVSIP
jgi:integrase